jgi:hypothetical protein
MPLWIFGIKPKMTDDDRGKAKDDRGWVVCPAGMTEGGDVTNGL